MNLKKINAKWDKPVTKGQLWCDSTHTSYLKAVKILETENRKLIAKVLEKAMATHSRTLAWRIPGTGEPGGLPSMGLPRVGHDWSNLAAAGWVSI